VIRRRQSPLILPLLPACILLKDAAKMAGTTEALFKNSEALLKNSEALLKNGEALLKSGEALLKSGQALFTNGRAAAPVSSPARQRPTPRNRPRHAPVTGTAGTAGTVTRAVPTAPPVRRSR
jgi:hypothetical protein